MSTIPMVIKKDGHSERFYDIYSRLLEDRIIVIDNAIEADISGLVVSQLLYLDNESNQKIQIYINTPGGDVTAGLAIYDTIKLIKSPVEIVAYGLCASIGVIILLAGSKRYCLPHTTFLIHQPWIPGHRDKKTAIDLKIESDQLLRYREDICKIIAITTNKDIEQVYKDTERDCYLRPEEALDYGLINGIIMPNGIVSNIEKIENKNKEPNTIRKKKI